MGVSWGTIKSLSLFFGPILLPKAISYYKKVRAQPTFHHIPIRPLPPAVSRALTILFVASLVFLIRTLPPFSPENLFTLTQSRLQISTDVLFTRLFSLRPGGLTESDNILRSKFTSMENRLLYFQHGPSVLETCSFCTSEDAHSYLYYSLPTLLAPHLFNLCILALVTSGLFTGKEASIWRTTSTLASAALIALDTYFTYTYNHQDNLRATALSKIDFFYWRSRIYRYIALATLDGVIGWMLYLSATNRAFVKAPGTSERVESATRVLEEVRIKLSAVGVLKNTIQRDEELRGRNEEFWRSEVRIMGEAMEDREVVEGLNNALEGRLNMEAISTDAETYAQHVVAPLQASIEIASGA